MAGLRHGRVFEQQGNQLLAAWRQVAERCAQCRLALGRQQFLLGRPGMFVREGVGVQHIPGRQRIPGRVVGIPGACLVADSGGMTGAGDRPGQETGAGRRWDVALSFAAEQRDHVEQVARTLKAQGVRCFYDADEQIDLWGKYLAEELPAIYGERAATAVIFVSAEYAARDWTRLERRTSLNRAVREKREYVLPARFDDTPLPGLLSDMVAVDLRGRTPEQFATMIIAKLAALLHRLREAGAQEQVSALASRLPGAGMFSLFLKEQDGQDRFQFGQEADGSPAGPWGWDDLD